MEPITVDTLHGRFPIVPKWRGKNLAVHKYIVGNDGDGPILSREAKRWQVTHIATGRAMATHRLDGCRLELVTQLAKLWDTSTSNLNAVDAQRWKLADQWRAACAAARNNGIATPPRPRKI